LAPQSPLQTAAEDYGSACIVPVMATAPGPGRSAGVSTSELYVSGMQNVLTSVDGASAPPTVNSPDGERCLDNRPGHVRARERARRRFPVCDCVWPRSWSPTCMGFGSHRMTTSAAPDSLRPSCFVVPISLSLFPGIS